MSESNFDAYRRGVREAFDHVNTIRANPQGRNAEETLDYIMRTLAELANGGIAALPQPDRNTITAFRTEKVDVRYLGWKETLIVWDLKDALPAQPSQRELDARIKLEVKAGLWDEVRTICVPHGAGVDKTITEWLAERLGVPALPAQPEKKS